MIEKWCRKQIRYCLRNSEVVHFDMYAIIYRHNNEYYFTAVLCFQLGLYFFMYTKLTNWEICSKSTSSNEQMLYGTIIHKGAQVFINIDLHV